MRTRVNKHPRRGNADSPANREGAPKRYTRAELARLRAMPAPMFGRVSAHVHVTADLQKTVDKVAAKVTELEAAYQRDRHEVFNAIMIDPDAAPSAAQLALLKSIPEKKRACRRLEIEERVLREGADEMDETRAANIKRRAQGKRGNHANVMDEITAEIGRIWQELTTEMNRPPVVNEALERFRLQTSAWKRRGTTLRTFQRYLAMARRQGRVPGR